MVGQGKHLNSIVLYTKLYFIKIIYCLSKTSCPFLSKKSLYSIYRLTRQYFQAFLGVEISLNIKWWNSLFFEIEEGEKRLQLPSRVRSKNHRPHLRRKWQALMTYRNVKSITVLPFELNLSSFSRASMNEFSISHSQTQSLTDFLFVFYHSK